MTDDEIHAAVAEGKDIRLALEERNKVDAKNRELAEWHRQRAEHFDGMRQKAVNALQAETRQHVETRRDLMGERDGLLDALRKIVNALGPEPPDCGCDGCGVEMKLALDTARVALQGHSRPV